MSSALTKGDLQALFASMSPQERYEIGIGPPPTGAASDTPKLSQPLDQVPEADVEKIVRACREGLKTAANGGQDVDSIAPLQAVAPSLAAYAVRNSTHRKKPVAHSVWVIQAYLQSPEAAAKRAAAKLRVPVSSTAGDAAAKSTSPATSAGGAK